METQDASHHWDQEADVVVVGYGAAGGAAAIAAHYAGAKVLIIEKMPHPGGISILSGGGVAFARSAEGAFEYLKRTCNGTTPDEALRPLAEGMVDIIDWVTELARVSGTEPSQSEVRGHGTYPFPGTNDMDSIKLKDFPAYDAFPWAKGLRGGARLFKMVVDNVAKRNIEVSLSTPAMSLVTGNDGEVLGVRVERAGKSLAIKARKAVVLCSGGFENNP
jgi:succinate dehydrogenase/fumarate reductase flavoprotein subunit